MLRDKEKLSGMDLDAPGGRVRLFVGAALAQGGVVVGTPAQAHYLLNVMRARPGDRVLLFNGRDGEWRAEIAAAGRRTVSLICREQTQSQYEVPDLWLVFSPIKKTPADYVVQKATELGVRVLQPVITHRTIARRVNRERLTANAIEAAEQSGRLSVPEVRPPLDLEKLLNTWPPNRLLIFCDEGGDARSLLEALDTPGTRQRPAAILTGPEGGFDDGERAAIRSHGFVVAVMMGRRILRADTAALSALSIWQAVCGDWS